MKQYSIVESQIHVTLCSTYLLNNKNHNTCFLTIGFYRLWFNRMSKIKSVLFGDTILRHPGFPKIWFDSLHVRMFSFFPDIFTSLSGFSDIYSPLLLGRRVCSEVQINSTRFLADYFFGGKFDKTLSHKLEPSSSPHPLINLSKLCNIMLKNLQQIVIVHTQVLYKSTKFQTWFTVFVKFDVIFAVFVKNVSFAKVSSSNVLFKNFRYTVAVLHHWSKLLTCSFWGVHFS